MASISSGIAPSAAAVCKPTVILLKPPIAVPAVNDCAPLAAVPLVTT